MQHLSKRKNKVISFLTHTDPMAVPSRFEVGFIAEHYAISYHDCQLADNHEYQM